MALALVAALAMAGLPAPAAPTASLTGPFSPEAQADNLALAGSRVRQMTPSLLAGAAGLAVTEARRRRRELAADPGRHPDPNFCTAGLCVGDPRLQHWQTHDGLVRRVLFTARDGATLSGHVWATRSGPARRPGIVIVNGSIIGFEQAYWWAAQSLAKAGYVVLTFDAQGEGDSDQAGAAPDQGEGLIAGSPPIGDGVPFYDGGEDALDLFLSRPGHPYLPRRSRTSHTSHADKQRARVRRGLDTAYDPLWRMLDRRHIGIAGHSYGAEAASYLAQYDHRISAVVAWDALCVPRNATGTELSGLLLPHPQSPGSLLGIPLPAALVALPKNCFGAPRGYPARVALRAPALGITGDYVLPTLVTDPPRRTAKAAASIAYSRAGVDSASITVRGASHIDWTFVAGVPFASLRGIDLATWYTIAWFDKYLRHDPTADRRLLTQRWRHDAATAAVDLAHDPNMLSRWFDSRIDIHVGRRRVECEHLRSGCAHLAPKRADCGPVEFGYLRVATSSEHGRRTICGARG